MLVICAITPCALRVSIYGLDKLSTLIYFNLKYNSAAACHVTWVKTLHIGSIVCPPKTDLLRTNAFAQSDIVRHYRRKTMHAHEPCTVEFVSLPYPEMVSDPVDRTDTFDVMNCYLKVPNSSTPSILQMQLR